CRERWHNLLNPLVNKEHWSAEEDHLIVHCFPSLDSRVLTDAGLAYLDDIQRRIHAGDTVLYACYDKLSKSLLYRPGTVRLVPAHQAPTSLVDFTSVDEAVRWGDGESEDSAEFDAATAH